MAINYGWFVKLTDSAVLPTPVSGLTSEGASLAATVKETTSTSCRLFGKGPSDYVDLSFGGDDVDVKRGNTIVATKFNLGMDAGEPNYLKIEATTNPTGSVPAYQITVNETDRGYANSSDASNDFWEVRALNSNAVAGNNVAISRATIKSDATTTVADWDGNYVLNASGTAFITRTEANNNPSSAESGFDGKIYDVTSVSGNHVTLPSGYSWEYVNTFTLPATVNAGSTANAFTAPTDFVTSSVNIAGLDVPFTFSSPPNGTFDAPTMGDVAGFPRFGTAVQAQLVDSAAGLTAQDNVAWEPSGTYAYVTLTSSPSTTDPASLCYGWTDPLVTGDQVVYDPAVITVSSSGIVTVVTTSATFSSDYYVIDDNGMQESVITQDSTGVTIPTASIDYAGTLPVGTPTTLSASSTDGTTFLWEVLSKPAGAVVAFNDPALEVPTVTVDTEGVYEFRFTVFNSAGDGSASDVANLNAQTESTLNLSVTGIGTGSRSVVIHDRTTRAVLFDGQITFTNDVGSVTLSVPVSTEVYGAYFGVDPVNDGTGLYGSTE